MRNAAITVTRTAARSLSFRAAASVALLGLVFLQVDWRTAGERVAGSEWPWFAAAVCLVEAAFLVGAVRWYWLLRGAGVELSFGPALRAYMIGMFSNNFLPTGFGGDATRALIVGRSGSRLIRVATSVLTDRLTSVGCLVILAWIALAVHVEAMPGRLVAGLLAVTLLGGAASAGAALLVWRGGRFARSLPAPLRKWAGDVRATLALYARQGALLTSTIVLGLAFQALTVAAMWLLARALGLDLPFALLATVVPMVLVATVLPISLAGFGVREGSYVILLGTAGVSATDATLLSLMMAATLAVASAVGAVPLVLRGVEPAPTAGMARD